MVAAAFSRADELVPDDSVLTSSAIAAGTGSACHAGHETPSPVLLAMGIEPTDALGALRLTVGRATSAPDVQRAAQMLVAAYSVS